MSVLAHRTIAAYAILLTRDASVVVAKYEFG